MNFRFAYDPQLTKPMEEELTSQGFTALHTAGEVEHFLKKQGTILLVINSVCGCAAGKARPGVLQSLNFKKKPKHLATVFAGVDRDAVEKARSMIDKAPSSPSVALFKDGKLSYFMPRQEIEGEDANAISSSLKQAYGQHC